VDALDDPSVVPEGTVVGFEAPVVTIANPVVKLPPRRGGTPRGTNLAPFSESSKYGECQAGVSVGSPGRSRTCDILINSQALYRLSYRGMPKFTTRLRSRTEHQRSAAGGSLTAAASSPTDRIPHLAPRR
jgi:hypothetical protein